MSYILSKIIGKDIFFAYPYFYSIEPSSVCNLRCPQCPSGRGELTRKKGFLQMEDFDLILKKISPYALHINFYLQGEPFLNSLLIKMIKKSSKQGIFTSTSTNAQVISLEMAREIVKSGLNHLIVSIDGATQSSYEKYRVGGDLQKALQAIENINKAKKELNKTFPKIEMQTLIFSHNENEIEEIKRLAKQLNVDKQTFKTAQIYHYEEGNELMPQKEEFSRYQKIGQKYVRKGQTPRVCRSLHSSLAITVEGDVIPCVFDKNAEFAFGNLLQSSLKEIWNSSVAKQFRKNKTLQKMTICDNCAYRK